jgi:hypothetical protein
MSIDERNMIYRRRLKAASMRGIARRLNGRHRKVLGFQKPT